MAEEAAEVDISVPSCLHLVSAFLAMEPPDVLLSFARDCGGGAITEIVQRFIWDHCVSENDGKCHVPYLKSFLKKLIVEVESNGGVVLDQLYEHYAFYMASIKEDDLRKNNSRVLKRISFLFPEEYSGISSCPKSRKLEVPLQCSLNMLEGDTGCCIWPSSLFLSEFILSFPELFLNKTCLEVGSGAGLVGISLAHVNASNVILTDGDLSTLANMKVNLDLNQLSTKSDISNGCLDANKVKCIHLPWEYAPENELQCFSPDIVLGADVIYDPLCLPHLVRVLGVLLKCENSHPSLRPNGCQVAQSNRRCCRGDTNGFASDVWQGEVRSNNTLNDEYLLASRKGPVAFIASVIRNIDTFNHFLSLAEQANLLVTHLTEKIKPIHMLPYMKSYQRSSIRMFSISYLCK